MYFILKILFIFTIGGFFRANEKYEKFVEPEKKITINVSANNVLAISQIGSIAAIIPLQKTPGNIFLSTNRVIIDEKEDFLFVTFGAMPLSVYQYRISTGQLIRIIEKGEDNLFDFPVKLFKYEDSNSIGIICKDEIFQYNYNGNLINVLKMQNPWTEFYFNNRYWGIDIEFTGKGVDKYALLSTSNFEKIDSNYEIIHNRGDCEPEFLKIKKDPFFNSYNDALYFTNQADPFLYRLKNNTVDIVCEYSFSPADFTCPDLFSRRIKLLGDKWLIIIYKFKESTHSYFYSLETYESFNLRNGLIKDDLFGTSNISATTIRNVHDDYFCFISPTDKVQSELIKNSDDSEIYLVIMKVD